MNKVEKTIKIAESKKAFVQVKHPNLSKEFTEYCKVRDTNGDEKACNILLSHTAKRQIDKANNSTRIKKEKKERILSFWKEYL